MTNPTNKKTKDQFIAEIPKGLGIEIIGEYVNTDTKIEYRCSHGVRHALPWQIKKFKNCCREGFYRSGKMWGKKIVPPEERLKWYKSQRPTLDLSVAKLVSGKRNVFEDVRCQKHPEVSFVGTAGKQHCTPCPLCKVDDFRELMALRRGVFHGIHKITPVSKAEKRWLDEVGVSERQYWLPEVKYRVDGFDPSTNTVYLYHGRFWHGCPETYDCDMIHPVIKLPMKDLYERTKEYEQKIMEAGYKLVVKWGT